MMRHERFLLRAWIAFAMAFTSVLGLADNYHLRGGEVFQGREVGRDAKGLKIQTAEGVRLIPWAELGRIERTDDSIGDGGLDPLVPQKKYVTVHMKNGRRMRGMLISSDPSEVVVDSNGVRLTLSREEIESVEELEGFSWREGRGTGLSGSEMMAQLPAETAGIIEELVDRCKGGFDELDSLSGHLKLKMNLAAFAGPMARQAVPQNFQAEAKIWGEKGGKFRVEFSASEPDAGGHFGLTMASDGQTLLGRMIMTGQRTEEQYFTLDVAQFQAMAEEVSATQAPFQPDQMDQLLEMAQAMSVTKGVPSETKLGWAVPYHMIISMDPLPIPSVGTNMEKLHSTLWVGEEDNLIHRLEMGIPSKPTVMVLEWTELHINPSLSDQLFRIQVPEGVVPQDLGQILGMGMMNAMGGLPGMPGMGLHGESW